MKKVFDYLISKSFILKISFLFIGLGSTLWFLIRVIPKPQRAFYPCMRAAAPVMSGFFIYLLSLTGGIFAYFSAKKFFKQKRYVYSSLFVVLFLVSMVLVMYQNTEKIFAANIKVAKQAMGPNTPVGVERGIFPGRVVWVHNPAINNWDEKSCKWYSDTAVSQTEAFKTFNKTITSLTGKATEAEAWVALFKYFNKTKKNLDEGYKAGQKIAIKINQNNTYSHANSDELNTSPQLALALLTSLIKEGGVPQENITVFDASRFITESMYTKCHDAFPNVIYLDNVGGDGRAKSAYIEKAIPYSADNGPVAQGLATCAIDADYLINVALLKGHVGQGVTLCAKNYYGVTSIHNDWRKNFHNNFNQDYTGKSKYIIFIDFMGHKDLGEKTMLFLIDGIYGSKLVYGPPTPKMNMAPFNGNWACSLFASQDGVAIDAVGLDFLRNEWPDAPDMDYSDQYLIEAAQADNPPSKTMYDPEKDGTQLKSLGVMEHWNNATDKQYSRNLGKNYGIELYKVTL